MAGKVLRKFASEFGDLEGIEQVLLISPPGWKEILDGIQTWTDCSLLLQVYGKLKALEIQFPEMVRETLHSIEAFGIWMQVNEQLGSLCNQAKCHDLEGLKEDLTSLDQLQIASLQLNIKNIAAKFHISICKEKKDEVTQESCHLESFPQDNLNLKLPNLEANKTIGGYSDSSNYLRIQYQLFSEDFVYPLRQGLQKVRNEQPTEDVYKYGRVQILGPCQVMTGWNVSFDVQINSQDYNYSKMDWESSSKLMQGSLVVLLDLKENKTILGAVQSRVCLQQGVLSICLLNEDGFHYCLLYTSPSPRDRQKSRMPSSA